MDVNNIIAVYGTALDRDYLIAYVGNGFEYINEYFDDNRGYGLRLKRIEVLDLSTDEVKNKIALKKRKAQIEDDVKNKIALQTRKVQIENELKEINERLSKK